MPEVPEWMIANQLVQRAMLARERAPEPPLENPAEVNSVDEPADVSFDDVQEALRVTGKLPMMSAHDIQRMRGVINNRLADRREP